MAVFDFSIGNWHIETITEVANPIHIHFLHLVSNIFTFSRFTHAVTFNGMGQDNRWFTLSFLCFFSAAKIFFGS